MRSPPQLLAEREDVLTAVRELSLGGELQLAKVAVAWRSAIRHGIPRAIAKYNNYCMTGNKPAILSPAQWIPYFFSLR